MNQFEDIKKAEKLFAEYKEGDTFERRTLYSKDESDWEPVEASSVIHSFESAYEVRRKPKPVRRLKQAWEILREAIDDKLVRHDEKAVYIYAPSLGREIPFAELLDFEGVERVAYIAKWPNHWFETVETATPSTDRVAEMANAAADKYLLSNGSKLLATVIREECSKRNIT